MEAHYGVNGKKRTMRPVLQVWDRVKSDLTKRRAFEDGLAGTIATVPTTASTPTKPRGQKRPAADNIASGTVAGLSLLNPDSSSKRTRPQN